jgi:hypothetical protein
MAASLAFAGSALGDHEDDRRGPGRGFGRVDPPVASCDLDPYVGRSAPGRIGGPAYGGRDIVIPSRYETIYEEVWVEPVYQWVTRKVWVPKRRRHRHLDLDVGKFSLHLDLGKGRRRHHRRGHYETVRERVLVRAGYFETVAREVLVEPGRARGFRSGFRHNDDAYRGGGRHGGRAFKGKSRRARLISPSRR